MTARNSQYMFTRSLHLRAVSADQYLCVPVKLTSRDGIRVGHGSRKR